MNSGTTANKRGKQLESFVKGLVPENYQFVKANHFFALMELNQPIFCSQCWVGTDIYGKRRRVDFILYHPEIWPKSLVIQCKWQASSGSVHEKYPFEVLSINKSKLNTIIILDGEGYPKEAKNWLYHQAGKKYLKHVFSLGEFSKFVAQGNI